MIRNGLGPWARFLVVAAAVACWLPLRFRSGRRRGMQLEHDTFGATERV